LQRFKIAIMVGALTLLPGNTANSSGNVARIDGGHTIGNPQATTQLTEYVSYTCSHCADFAREGDPVLKFAFVSSGKLKLEIRHLVRDPIDLTAAMMTNCGEASKFPLNHSAIMLSQNKWLPLASKASPAQIQRWSMKDQAAARRNIANDFGFYDIMETRGYRITELDQCLNDNAKAQQLARNSFEDGKQHSITGTPSFLLNGELLAGVHNWATLQKALNERFTKKPAK
jgi:protein-disulfide isomerase